jgi:hypothetical protein
MKHSRFQTIVYTTDKNTVRDDILITVKLCCRYLENNQTLSNEKPR